MLVGYARVSTQDQKSELQHDALTGAGCEKVFTEKRSGAKADRPELIAAMRMQNSYDIAQTRKREGEITIARYQPKPKSEPQPGLF